MRENIAELLNTEYVIEFVNFLFDLNFKNKGMNFIKFKVNFYWILQVWIIELITKYECIKKYYFGFSRSP